MYKKICRKSEKGDIWEVAYDISDLITNLQKNMQDKC